MTVSWLGGSAKWYNGAFWSTATIPSPSDAVLIAASGIYAIVADASVAAGSVTINAAQAVVAVQGSNSVTSALLVNGPVALQAGTLELLNGGVLTGATLQVTGGTLLAAGGAFDHVTVQGTLALGVPNTQLYVADGLTFSGAGGTGQGALQLYGNNLSLRFLDNETLDNVAVSVASYSVFTAPGTLTFGTKLSLADAASIQVTAPNFINSGVIDATHGGLSIYGNFTNTGVLTAGILGYSLGFYGIDFFNYGVMSLGNGYTQLSSNASLSTVSSTGQVVTQAIPVSFINAGTFTLAAHGSVYVATNAYYYGGGTGGAYVTNSGLMTIDGDLELSLQNLLNDGTIAIDSGGTLDANFLAATGALLGATGTLTNHGVIRIGQGGTLELGVNALITVSGLGSIDSQGGTLAVTRGTLDDTGGTLYVGGTGAVTNVAFSGGATLHGGVVIAAGNTPILTQGTLDAVTWAGVLALPSASSIFYTIALQNGFSLEPGAGLALGALDAEGGGGVVSLTGATLSPAALNLDTTLALGSDLTIDAGSVLNAASGRTLVTSVTTGSPVGTLTLQGTSYATAPGGSLGIGRPLLNNGMLVIGNGDVVSVGSLAGTGTVEIGTGELSIAAGASASEAIRFNGPGGTIALTQPLLAGGGMLAQVQNFGTGDTIDLGTTTADQVFYQGGNLILTKQGTLSASVPFSTIFTGVYSANDFQLVANKVGGVGVTTTVPGAATSAGPAVIAADVFATATATPFSALVINDANATELDSVTVTTTASGTFSNPGATGALDGSRTYVAAGTAAALMAELQTLVFTETAGTSSVTKASFTIDVSSPSGTTAITQNATVVSQPLGLASLAAGGTGIAAGGVVFTGSPDGSSFAAPVAGATNEAVVTAPATGSVAVLNPGFQAEYLSGTNNATLIDPGYGNALLAANSGSDLLYANGNGDSLVGGTGGDTMIATGAATIQALATAGNTVIIGGAGATSIQGPVGSANATIIAGSGATAIVAGGASNLIALGSGMDTVASSGSDTIFAGIGTDSISASGFRMVAVLGGGVATVNAIGFAQTILGGSGQSTVTMNSANLLFGGSGTAVAFAQQSDTIFGTSGSLTVSGGGVFQGGSNGGNFLFLNSTLIGSIAFGGGNNDTLVSHGSAGGQLNQLVAGAGNETLVADPNSANTAIFTGPGNDSVAVSGAQDTVFASTGAYTAGTGAGAYTFAFTAGHAGGRAAISGFDPTKDRIVLTAYSPGTAAAALNGAAFANGSETIALPDGTQITLLGFTGLTAGAIMGG